MTTNTNLPAQPAIPRSGGALPAPSWQSPPWTTEERLQRIQVMKGRINGYIDFMCQVGTMNGTSAEAKEKAVTAFYDRMILVERQLGRIQEELQLG